VADERCADAAALEPLATQSSSSHSRRRSAAAPSASATRWRAFIFLEIEIDATLASCLFNDPDGFSGATGSSSPEKDKKFGKGLFRFPVCIYYNPLKSHKTAKEFLWKSLEKTGGYLEMFGKKAWRFPGAAPRRCAVVRDARDATRIARHSLASREFLSLSAFRRVRPRRHRL
jgi:hypothetical protein